MKEKSPTRKTHRRHKLTPLPKEKIVQLPAYKIVGLFKSGLGNLAEQHHYYLYGLKD